MGDNSDILRKSKTLACLSLNNLILHDKRDYDGISDNTERILRTLGYVVGISSVCEKVKEIYRLADTVNNSNADETYNQMEKLADEVDDMMNEKHFSRYEIRWWRFWRSRKIIRASLYLFVHSLFLSGISHPLSSFKTTYYLLRAGHYHNKKELKSALFFIERSWQTIAEKGDELPFVF